MKNAIYYFITKIHKLPKYRCDCCVYFIVLSLYVYFHLCKHPWR